MVFRRQGRFDELIRSQLDLFAVDEAELLAEAQAADAAQTRSGRDDAEEIYGDYQLVVDALADRLFDVREVYAHTLDPDVAEEYRAAFTRAAGKRFRPYTGLLDEVDTSD